MVISGKTYTTDLIIFPDRIFSSWWRKTGHNLSLEDIRDILDEDFDVLIIGTGSLGLMKVGEEIIRKIESRGASLIIHKTKKAAAEFNRISIQKKVIAAFHLTC